MFAICTVFSGGCVIPVGPTFIRGGGQKNRLFVNFYTIENVNGGG